MSFQMASKCLWIIRSSWIVLHSFRLHHLWSITWNFWHLCSTIHRIIEVGADRFKISDILFNPTIIQVILCSLCRSTPWFVRAMSLFNIYMILILCSQVNASRQIATFYTRSRCYLYPSRSYCIVIDLIFLTLSSCWFLMLWRNFQSKKSSRWSLQCWSLEQTIPGMENFSTEAGTTFYGLPQMVRLSRPFHSLFIVSVLIMQFTEAGMSVCSVPSIKCV